MDTSAATDALTSAQTITVTGNRICGRLKKKQEREQQYSLDTPVERLNSLIL